MPLATRSHPCRFGHFLTSAFAGGTLAIAIACGARAADELDLTDLSLEELLTIEVTTVSRAAESVLRAPAAVYVITNDDIRRSGVRNLPDALRLAPGVEVAQVEANAWSISVRGFNDQFSNKLLVLIDGRSVVTPLFSDIYWDLHNPILEDVERIEVIRGPGASLWGSNAVNGVINIITKSSADTQGTFIEGGGGFEERGFGALRHGGQIGDAATYRIFAQYFNRDGGVDADGNSEPGDWEMFHLGFRTDWDVSRQDTLLLEGELFRGDSEQRDSLSSPLPPFSIEITDDLGRRGGHFLARWSRYMGDWGDIQVQGYYDYYDRQSHSGGEKRHTADLDFQHSVEIGDQHSLTWGLGYRYTQNNFGRSPDVSVRDSTRHDQIISAIVQDRIAVVPGRFDLILGSKFEYNTFSGFEIQPTARARWMPNENTTVWGAFSRAVRTPSQIELDASAVVSSLPPLTPPNVGPIPAVILISGNNDLDAEELTTFELGYRSQLTPDLTVDAAVFYSIYDKLRSIEPGIPTFRIVNGIPQTVIPLTAANGLEGDAVGLELAGTWQVRSGWRLQGTYSFIDVDVMPGPRSQDFSFAASIEGSSPKHQIGLRSYWDVTPEIAFDVLVKYVDDLKASGVDAYVDLDLRLAWQPNESVEFGLVGQNLLQDHRAEFLSTQSLAFRSIEPERAAFAYIKLHF